MTLLHYPMFSHFGTVQDCDG